MRDHSGHARLHLHAVREKTGHWPRHFDAVDAPQACGMLDLEPVTVGGKQMAPRVVLLAAIEPRLRALRGDGHVCVMFNTVVGVKANVPTRISYFMWDEADVETGHGPLQPTRPDTTRDFD